jgi:hypothetical protein
MAHESYRTSGDRQVHGFRVFHDVTAGVRGNQSERVTTTGATHRYEPAGSTRLREQLAERDEIIVALQHVIRDLRHELENQRAEHAYAAFARPPRSSASSR